METLKEAITLLDKLESTLQNPTLTEADKEILRPTAKNLRQSISAKMEEMGLNQNEPTDPTTVVHFSQTEVHISEVDEGIISAKLIVCSALNPPDFNEFNIFEANILIEDDEFCLCTPTTLPIFVQETTRSFPPAHSLDELLTTLVQCLEAFIIRQWNLLNVINHFSDFFDEELFTTSSCDYIKLSLKLLNDDNPVTCILRLYYDILGIKPENMHLQVHGEMDEELELDIKNRIKHFLRVPLAEAMENLFPGASQNLANT